jgi:F-type H+-transporting ATPase subunit b
MHHEESFFADPRSWVAIAFVIFFVLFGKKIWGVITGILDKRAETIRGELAEAQRLRREAEAMLAEAAASRKAALAQAKDLLEGASREATRLAALAAAEAEQSASRREKMAMDRITAAERAAVDEVRLAAADVAGEATRMIISESMSPEASAAIIDRAISGLPAALSLRRAA